MSHRKFTRGPWLVRHGVERSEILASGRTLIAETQNSQAPNEHLEGNDAIICACPDMVELLFEVIEGRQTARALALRAAEILRKAEFVL